MCNSDWKHVFMGLVRETRSGPFFSCEAGFKFEMAKGCRGRRRVSSRQYRQTPYLLPSNKLAISEGMCTKKCAKGLDKKDWKDATCSVCMECPHNAVLLLCSSHDKGCRPYMCATDTHFSNCLDQYKKAYSKVITPAQGPFEKGEATELACPLCRGQVKGWALVKEARKYLNSKKRSCMQDGCAFTGTYKELRKHVRAVHPSGCPREVDPTHEQKWRRLERDRERDDVISTIRSSMPGAVVFGDYVIEGNQYADFDPEEDDLLDEDDGEDNVGGFEAGFDSNMVNIFFLLHAFGQTGGVNYGRRLRRGERGNQQASEEVAAGIQGISPVIHFESSDDDGGDDNDDGDAADDDGVSLIHDRLPDRAFAGHTGRRRRGEEANGESR